MKDTYIFTFKYDFFHVSVKNKKRKNQRIKNKSKLYILKFFCVHFLLMNRSYSCTFTHFQSERLNNSNSHLTTCKIGKQILQQSYILYMLSAYCRARWRVHTKTISFKYILCKWNLKMEGFTIYCR